MWSRLKALLQYEPAVISWAINGGLAAVLAFLAHLSPTEIAAVTTITTAAAAVVTALRTRPISVSVITGAVATIATAVSAFGLNLPTPVVGVVVTVLSTVLGLLFRQNLTPTARLTVTPSAPGTLQYTVVGGTSTVSPPMTYNVSSVTTTGTVPVPSPPEATS